MANKVRAANSWFEVYRAINLAADKMVEIETPLGAKPTAPPGYSFACPPGWTELRPSAQFQTGADGEMVTLAKAGDEFYYGPARALVAKPTLADLARNCFTESGVFDSEAEVRELMAGADQPGWWGALYTIDAKKFAHLIVAALDAGNDENTGIR